MRYCLPKPTNVISFIIRRSISCINSHNSSQRACLCSKPVSPKTLWVYLALSPVTCRNIQQHFGAPGQREFLIFRGLIFVSRWPIVFWRIVISSLSYGIFLKRPKLQKITPLIKLADNHPTPSFLRLHTFFWSK